MFEPPLMPEISPASGRGVRRPPVIYIFFCPFIFKPRELPPEVGLTSKSSQALSHTFKSQLCIFTLVSLVSVLLVLLVWWARTA